MLDSTGDLLCAVNEDGAETLVALRGAEQAAQAASMAVSQRQGRIWWNESLGVDYDGLFFNSGRSDADMAAIRAAALREAILAVPGVDSFEGTNEITFSRNNRILTPSIPCIRITCEASRVSATIEPIL